MSTRMPCGVGKTNDGQHATHAMFYCNEQEEFFGPDITVPAGLGSLFPDAVAFGVAFQEWLKNDPRDLTPRELAANMQTFADEQAGNIDPNGAADNQPSPQGPGFHVKRFANGWTVHVDGQADGFVFTHARGMLAHLAIIASPGDDSLPGDILGKGVDDAEDF